MSCPNQRPILRNASGYMNFVGCMQDTFARARTRPIEAARPSVRDDRVSHIQSCEDDSEPASKIHLIELFSYPQGLFTRFKKIWMSDFVGAVQCIDVNVIGMQGSFVRPKAMKFSAEQSSSQAHA